jgi:glycosyltransferase involved in cell wall biosynthesis
MLRECLRSILAQTFSDFEVIVGNDYTQQTISGSFLGIEDPRIRFVNYAQNIGEMNNMNALLKISRGRYFTWLADDDMYAPVFLEAAHSALKKFGFPPCVFTGFMQGSTFSDRLRNPEIKTILFDGRQFLRQYLSRKLKTAGSAGLFAMEYIKRIGGIKQLGNGFSPGSDNLLAIQAGLLEKVVYIDAQLYFLRAHEQSISFTSVDVDAYKSAQNDLLSASIELFSNDRLKEDFDHNLFLLLKWCIRDYFAVLKRSGSLQWGKMMGYSILVFRYVARLRDYRCRIIIDTARVTYMLIRHFAAGKIKAEMRKFRGV